MSLGQTSTLSRCTSLMHLLLKYKTNYSINLKGVMTSPRAHCHSKIKMSKIEGPTPSSTSMDGHEPRRENHSKGITRSHNNGFSFANH